MDITEVGIQAKKDVIDDTTDETDTIDPQGMTEGITTTEEILDGVQTITTEVIEMVAIATDTIEDSTTIVPHIVEVGTQGTKTVVVATTRITGVP